MKRYSFALVCLFIGVSGLSFGQLKADEWGKLGNDFQWSHQKISGDWQESQNWDGWFCNGYYNYKIHLTAELKKVDLELTDEGFMVATADVANIFAKVDGKYRSKTTACLPMGGWLGVGTDSAQLRTEVHFGEGGDMKDVRLKILSTKLGTLKMGRLFPQWFESFFTGVINRALTVVWSTKLGGWISEKITEVARKQIPERNR